MVKFLKLEEEVIIIKLNISNFPKGEITQDKLVIGQRADGSDIAIIYHIIKGIENGPTVWLNGAVHGDELNGPYALLKLLKNVDPKKISGTIIITPISNVLAFNGRQKNTPRDLLDLDQQFPGNAKGTISQRIAFELFETFGEPASVIIDCHTVGSLYEGKPYTVVKKINDELEEYYQKARHLAYVFGGEYHCSLDFSKNLNEIPGNTFGFLDVQAQLNKKISFMVELGQGGILDSEDVRFSYDGFIRILNELSIINTSQNSHPFSNRIINRRYYLYSDVAGLLTYTVHAGQVVNKGELIAEITNINGEVKQYFAEKNIHIIISRRNAVVETGDRLFFFGKEWGKGQWWKKAIY